MILRNHKTEMQLNAFEWTAATCLAMLADPKQNDDWPLARFNDDHVSGANAIAFAKALELALNDIPDEPKEAFPWDEFAGERKQRLRDLIQFCEGGGFILLQ